jgi:hypothetical protein
VGVCNHDSPASLLRLSAFYISCKGDFPRDIGREGLAEIEQPKNVNGQETETTRTDQIYVI